MRAATIRRSLFILSLFVAAFALGEPDRARAEPLDIVKAYFEAAYARDFSTAYARVSLLDRQVWNQARYLRAHPSFDGFTLRLAKRIAGQIEFRIVDYELGSSRARYTLHYKVPAADELSSVLFNWDQERLNALSHAEQRRILDRLESLINSRNMISTEGQETLNLVKEHGHWRIFLDWASGIPVSFAVVLPSGAPVEVRMLTRELFARIDEPFETNLKIRNRGQDTVTLRIDHRVAPKKFTGRIAMIACGFLQPLTLNPGEEREISSAYLLDAGFPKKAALGITYQLYLVNSATAPRADTLEK